MTIESELRKIARELAAQAQDRLARLDREVLDLESRLAKKQTERNAARLGPQRLADFQPQIGSNYQCPRCWIEDESPARLTPIPGDLMRCGRCDSDFPV
jgi:hypothetical protein